MSEGRPDDARSVLLISADLMARERVRSAAAHLQMASRFESAGQLERALGKDRPDVVVLDLDAGRDELLAEVEAARAAGLLPDTVIGYYSHVDENLAEAARRAGCTAVRRGRFWSQLSDYLQE